MTESAFDRAREQLDEFLGGKTHHVSAYCEECGGEL